MTRQVQVEAVFNTQNAIRSADAYRAAIERARTAHAGLDAAIQATTGSLATLSTNLRAAQQAAAQMATAQATAASSATAQINRQTAAYNATAIAARAAAAATQAAQGGGGGGARPPQTPGAAAAGGGGFLLRMDALFQAAGSSATHFLNTLGSIGSSLISVTNLVAALGAYKLTTNLIEYSDSWVNVTGRIRAALTAEDDFVEVADKLFQIAQKTRTPVAELADTFSRMFISGRSMGLTVDQALRLSEVLADGALASHRMASEVRSLTTQFPQAIAAGKLAGNEFTSLIRAAPLLIQAIAENIRNVDGSIGTSIGKLTALAYDQRLFNQLWIPALMAGMEKMAEAAAKAPLTIAGAVTQLSNAWTEAVGKASEATKFTERITNVIKDLIAAMDSVKGRFLIEVALKSVAGAIETLATSVTSGHLTQGLIGMVQIIKILAAGVQAFATAMADPNKGIYGIYTAIKKAMSEAKEESDVFVASLWAQMHAAGEAETRLKRLHSLRGPILEGIRKFDPTSLTHGGRTISAKPEPYIQTDDPVDRHLESVRKSMREMIAEISLQNAVLRARASGLNDIADRLEGNYEIEKKITAEMRKSLPIDAARLEDQIRANTELKISERNRQQSATSNERLKAIREEADVQRQLATGDDDLIRNAKTKLEIEKAITAQLAQRNSALANLIEAEIRLKAALQRQAEQIEQWRGVFKSMGDSLVNSMIQAGKEGRSFASGLRDAAKQMVELLVRAVLLEPLVKNIANTMGQLTQGGLKGGPDSIIKALFGSGNIMGGEDAGMGSWMPTVMPAARGMAFVGGGVTHYDKGGVVNMATNFLHQGGAGQMGEMGSESIMPLFRGRDGKLGIRMAGGQQAASTTNVNITIAGDATDATVARMRSEAERVFASREPGTIRTSVAATRSEIVRDPRFLRR